MKCISTRPKDLIDIVACHKSAFPDAMSSKMGNSFVFKMMEWYLKSDRGVLFHLENKNNEILGYCGGIITKEKGLPGAVTSISQYSFNIFVLSFLIRPWMFFHSENLKKLSTIKKNIFLKFGLHKPVKTLSKEEFIPFMGLIVIGLKKKNQSKGLGAILLNEFEKRAIEDNDVEKIILSVKPENINAIKAYSKNGWKISKNSNTSTQMFKFTK